MIKRHVLVGMTAAAALLLGACTGAAREPAPAGAETGGQVKGEITVLTNRTDLVDTDFVQYAKEFSAKYPGASVKFEALADYSQVNNRLTTGDYGDVLNIPDEVGQDQLSTFFEPLGTVADLAKTYRFVNEKAYDGNVYGLAQGGSAEGVVYNRRIWTQAGITGPPKTPAQFLDDLKAVKAKTAAIPYYTNYKDGWPLGIWNSQRGILDEPVVTTTRLTQDPAPWSAGKISGITDGLLFDIVKDRLSEPDPVTTNWEQSKVMLATGKVSSMLLGSWSVSQLQEAATKAGQSADDIGFMPFPYQVDGGFHSQVNGDLKAAVSVHSKNKATARAWIDWFINDSGYISKQGFIPTARSQPLPAALDDFQKTGVTLVDSPDIPSAVTVKLQSIIKASQVDLTGYLYRQHLIDVARGAAAGDKASAFADLNHKWAAGEKTVGS